MDYATKEMIRAAGVDPGSAEGCSLARAIEAEERLQRMGGEEEEEPPEAEWTPAMFQAARLFREAERAVGGGGDSISDALRAAETLLAERAARDPLGRWADLRGAVAIIRLAYQAERS
jgi:hypothetical protein